MRLEDLGYNPKTGVHRKQPLTPEEAAFLGMLWVDHEGEGVKISADNLALQYMQKIENQVDRHRLEFWKREVRELQNHLLCEHRIPILSKAGNHGGYWIAATEGESEQFYDTFRKRGLTGLVKASRGKQSAMVDMVTQLSFEFEELVDRTEQTARIRPVGGMPLPAEVVDAFLARMTRDPARFADGLRKIREKYGAVLLPKERLRAVQKTASELQAMVAGLGN